MPRLRPLSRFKRAAAFAAAYAGVEGVKVAAGYTQQPTTMQVALLIAVMAVSGVLAWATQPQTLSKKICNLW